MKRKKHNQRIKQPIDKAPLSPLMKYNLTAYDDEIDIIAELTKSKISSRDWIIANRFDLQMRAKKYERMFGKYLIDHKVKFLHQAPFVVFGKIYFVDFYLPDLKIAIEIDGQYHNLISQKEYDKERERDMEWIGIKTIRIKNEIVLNKGLLNTKLKVHNILK